MMLSDLHTHSVASGHGTTDTITFMANAAAKRGMKLLGITDHGPAMPGAPSPSYFRGLKFCPDKRFGVQFLYGVELNILDNNGTVDLTEDIAGKLDYAIAGMHYPLKKPGTLLENTQAYIEVMKLPYVHIIAHPDDVRYPVDYQMLVQAAKEFHVLLEINNTSLEPDGYRGNTKANNIELLKYCKQYEHPVLLSSDSHGGAHIGDFQYAMELINSNGFPKSLVINDNFIDFLIR